MKNLIVALLFITLSSTFVFGQNTKTQPSITDVGKEFPKVDLKTTDGQIIKSTDLAGKVVVYNFGFKACPPCRAKSKGLNTFYNKYKDNKDVAIIYISADKEDVAKEVKAANKAEYAVVSEPDGRKVFGIKGVPTCLVVNKKGVVTYNHIGGPINEKDAEEYLMNEVASEVNKELKK